MKRLNSFPSSRTQRSLFRPIVRPERWIQEFDRGGRRSDWDDVDKMCDAIGERNAKIDFGLPDRYTSNVADQPQTSGRLSAGMCPGLVDVVLMRIPPVLLLLCGLLFVSTVRGDDWPQWMGPQRDNVWREDGLLEKFPEGGLKVLWSTSVAGGYSGPAVAGGKVFTASHPALLQSRRSWSETS